jgi:hypothetical protein
VNLNPYLTYIEMGAAAALLAVSAGAGYHFGALSGEAKAADARTALEADRADQSQAIATAVLAERASAAATAAADHATETQHAKTIIRIDSAPPIRTPLLVYGPGALCAGSLPGAETETGGVPAGTDGGRSQPVDRGRDIRPAIEAVKKRIERVMADYRQQDAEWPAK